MKLGCNDKQCKKNQKYQYDFKAIHDFISCEFTEMMFGCDFKSQKYGFKATLILSLYLFLLNKKMKI